MIEHADQPVPLELTEVQKLRLQNAQYVCDLNTILRWHAEAMMRQFEIWRLVMDWQFPNLREDLRDISVKRYAPTWREIRHAMRQKEDTVKRLLQILERIGRIQRHRWNRGRGITLIPFGSQPAVALGESTAQDAAVIVVPRATKKCYDCDDPAVAGKTRCELHLTRVREACERSYAKKRAAGRCVRCGALTVEGKALCDRHRETRNRSYAKKRTAQT